MAKKRLYLFFILTFIIIIYNNQINKNCIKKEKCELLLIKIKKFFFTILIFRYKTITAYKYYGIKIKNLKNIIVYKKNYYLVFIIFELLYILY